MEDYAVQTVEVGGVPYTEYRYSPEPEEQVIITIEFTPEVQPMDDYSYPQPQFVFKEEVALVKQVNYCQQNKIALSEEVIDFYPITAMELVERKLSNGRLAEAPYWLYGLRSHKGTRELMWFSEDELISKREVLGQIPL